MRYLAAESVLQRFPSISEYQPFMIGFGALSRRCGALLVIAAMTACGGGGGGSVTPPAPTPSATSSGSPSPIPSPTHTPSPSPSPSTAPTASPIPSPTATPSGNYTSAAAFSCPASDASLDAVARATRSGSVARSRADATHRGAARVARAGVQRGYTTLAVSYDRGSASRISTAISGPEAKLGAGLLRIRDYPSLNLTLHELRVSNDRVNATIAALQSTPGVRGVGKSGERRYHATVLAGYLTNDPYFAGFISGTNRENASLPGQWDMHAIKLEYAFAYSQADNGPSGIVNTGALGSSSVPIAIIDTGEDATHPELASVISRQQCFITNDAGTAQSASNYSTDGDGHGTNVSGIAAAATNNSFGFVGAGGKSSIWAYRVFPTPDDTCVGSSPDHQCSANTADIASAIDDAVNNGAKVINISLGGKCANQPHLQCVGGCYVPSNTYPGGAAQFVKDYPAGDSDPVEGAAIENAISHNVIVVAAAGNGGIAGLSAPACDTGVIAVGATSLDDGQALGTSRTWTAGTSSNPVEYVAGYSQWGSPASNPKSSSAWGIVAPGGDPSSDTDNDNLHWIENIWTSTPFQSSPSDQNFIGECTNDYPNGSLTSSPDCRMLIAGTSMATPHVAGAVALILAATGTSGPYATPSAMKALLCATADDLGAKAGAYQGCGRLNIYRAMAKALNDPILP
jgi:subtilisin family serine protease